MRKFVETLLIWIPSTFVLTSIVLVVSLKWGQISKTPLMMRREIEFRNDKDFNTICNWTPLKDFSPAVRSAVITSEDARFYSHNGFDWEEVRRMHHRHAYLDGSLRGCSTISQQTARNLFTFCSDTWLRKTIEAWWTILLETFWSKDRILEVYLNIVETGQGLYGFTAATDTYFHCHPSELQLSEACTLALCLPAPLKRTPAWVWENLPSRIENIHKQSTLLLEQLH